MMTISEKNALVTNIGNNVTAVRVAIRELVISVAAGNFDALSESISKINHMIDIARYQYTLLSDLMMELSNDTSEFATQEKMYYVRIAIKLDKMIHEGEELINDIKRKLYIK